MTFTLIKGPFRGVGKTTDGASVRFAADDADQINNFAGGPPDRQSEMLRCNWAGGASTCGNALRRPGIGPNAWARGACDRLVDFVVIGTAAGSRSADVPRLGQCRSARRDPLRVRMTNMGGRSPACFSAKPLNRTASSKFSMAARSGLRERCKMRIVADGQGIVFNLSASSGCWSATSSLARRQPTSARWRPSARRLRLGLTWPGDRCAPAGATRRSLAVFF